MWKEIVSVYMLFCSVQGGVRTWDILLAVNQENGKGQEIHNEAQWENIPMPPFFSPQIPGLSSCVFPFCPKEGHFCPVGDDDIDVKR